jgi:transposase-like protein
VQRTPGTNTLLIQPDATVSSIARLLGVSRSTIYKYVPELKPTGIQPVETNVPESHPEIAESNKHPTDLR